MDKKPKRPRRQYKRLSNMPARRIRPNSHGEYVYERRKSLTEMGLAGISKADAKLALVYPQAANIIAKFGGASELCRMVNMVLRPDEVPWAPSTIYRWTYPVEAQGTGGEIPTRKIKTVLRAARLAGILITIEDLYPKLFDEEKLAHRLSDDASDDDDDGDEGEMADRPE